MISFLHRDGGDGHPAPAIDVSLEIGLGQFGEGEVIAEGGDQVVEVDPCGVEGVLLVGTCMDGKEPVAEVPEFRQLGSRDATKGDFPVVLEELSDTDAGRQVDQPLPQAHQEVLGLGGLRLGLLLGHLPQGERDLLALVAEINPVTSAPFLDSGHGCGSYATATLLPICYQVTPGRKNKGLRLATQPLTLQSAEERT